MKAFHLAKLYNILIYSILILICTVGSSFAANEAWSPMFAICATYRFFAGPLGKTLAMLCLVMIGVSFFMSKVSWTTAATLVMGVSAIFGAPTIVNLLTGGGGDGCSQAGKIGASGTLDWDTELSEAVTFGDKTKTLTQTVDE